MTDIRIEYYSLTLELHIAGLHMKERATSLCAPEYNLFDIRKLLCAKVVIVNGDPLQAFYFPQSYIPSYLSTI